MLFIGSRVGVYNFQCNERQCDRETFARAPTNSTQHNPHTHSVDLAVEKCHTHFVPTQLHKNVRLFRQLAELLYSIQLGLQSYVGFGVTVPCLHVCVCVACVYVQIYGMLLRAYFD